ncbi:MAG: YidC/Oxa1 family insertase periplasmic-domain containing protein [Kiritimatiellia bacterium]
MNKTEKLISFLIGLLLVGYLFHSMTQKRQTPVASPAAPAASASASAPSVAPPPAPVAAVPSAPAQTNVLENGELRLEFTSRGAAIQKATLLGYGTRAGEVNAENPPLTLDFTAAPLGALELPGIAKDAAYEVVRVSSNELVYANGPVTRTYRLGADYQITLEESIADAALAAQPSKLSLGVLARDESRLGMLSVDSWDPAGKGAVLHHDEGDSPLRDYLASGGAGCSCSGGSGGAAKPASTTIAYPAPQKWIALKNRFFVTALASTTQGAGASATAGAASFEATINRDPRQATYAPGTGSVRAVFAGGAAQRTSVLYVGPKKLSTLADLGMRDVMEFGMWRVLCYPLVWILNAFHWLIPNFGVAIILLTILVRLVFWPLTHQSTVGMKKMQELQPRIKELQTKFKDNPQRLQQETFALYREYKVNPLSSCLPMLIQIPVFVALFNVLRTAVELRYAGFLWIADLSEPEGLFASWFPFGGLNILPILMAGTMALQSWLTPGGGGDPSQRRMMMIMMPAMMLLMFYSFPAALSLYWFLSNVMSIVQMWVIRRKTARAQQTVPAMEIIDPPVTRQMRRHP